MRKRKKSNGAAFSLKNHDIAIEHCTGSTHPGTENRPVCGRLMLSMVSGMFSGLRLGQSPNSENTEYKSY